MAVVRSCVMCVKQNKWHDCFGDLDMLLGKYITLGHVGVRVRVRV